MPAPTTTLPERLLARCKDTPNAIAYLHRGDDGKWLPVTWHTVAQRAIGIARGLSLLGVQAGDRVAIMLPTSPEWEYCQQAVLMLGATVVGIDAHDAPSNLHHILELTQPRALVTGNERQLALIRETWRAPEIVVVAEPEAPHPDIHALADFLQTLDTGATPPSAPSPDDIATIVFTSGSTGTPKGIAYTHRQVALACDAILDRFPSISNETTLVCWLPLSNLFQRIINLCAIVCGARSYFVSNPQDIVRLLPEIQPSLFIGVPRFFEKLHAGIMAEVAKQPAPVRLLIAAAWTTGMKTASMQRSHGQVSLPWRALSMLANPILARLRAVMGQRMQFMVSGSAPLPSWLMDRFHGLGWLVLEAYGISENVMPVALNTPTHYRFGSVGRALPGNELLVAEDGELLIRGDGVFSGYYGTDAHDTPIDSEAYLHTGDFARLDADGYVWLEGRKSEVFKTSTGRRIAPAPLEAALKQIDYVDHAIIVGRDRPFPMAIITISPEHEMGKQVQTPEGQKTISSDIARACEAFTPYQRPGAVIASTRPLGIATGELTANLKIRRKQVETRFEREIERAYEAPRLSPDTDIRTNPPVILTP
ncbi:MAG: AMP-binding protein [Azoarcus sp. PHD]|nr:MAG: AMP-binding protein [Azoarcus sp. PHD]